MVAERREIVTVVDGTNFAKDVPPVSSCPWSHPGAHGVQGIDEGIAARCLRLRLLDRSTDVMICFWISMPEVTHAPACSCPQQIGRHQININDSTIHIHFYGTCNADEATKMMALFERVHADRGPLYVLMNLTDAGLPSLEARRIIAEAAPRFSVHANVYYGVSFITRAVAILLHRVIVLVKKQESKVFFASDESEGQRIIQQCRMRERSE